RTLFLSSPSASAFAPPCSSALPRRFDPAYAGSNQHNLQAERQLVAVGTRVLSLVCGLFAVILEFVPAAAKDTGRIFVSNEKSNNVILLEPKTSNVVKNLKVSRR